MIDETTGSRPRYFDDDGDEPKPGPIPKPSLCLHGLKDGDPAEEIRCTLNRLDQDGKDEFECGAYQPAGRR